MSLAPMNGTPCPHCEHVTELRRTAAGWMCRSCWRSKREPGDDNPWAQPFDTSYTTGICPLCSLATRDGVCQNSSCPDMPPMPPMPRGKSKAPELLKEMTELGMTPGVEGLCPDTACNGVMLDGVCQRCGCCLVLKLPPAERSELDTDAKLTKYRSDTIGQFAEQIGRGERLVKAYAEHFETLAAAFDEPAMLELGHLARHCWMELRCIRELLQLDQASKEHLEKFCREYNPGLLALSLDERRWLDGELRTRLMMPALKPGVRRIVLGILEQMQIGNSDESKSARSGEHPSTSGDNAGYPQDPWEA